MENSFTTTDLLCRSSDLMVSLSASAFLNTFQLPILSTDVTPEQHATAWSLSPCHDQSDKEPVNQATLTISQTYQFSQLDCQLTLSQQYSFILSFSNTSQQIPRSATIHSGDMSATASMLAFPIHLSDNILPSINRPGIPNDTLPPINCISPPESLHGCTDFPTQIQTIPPQAQSLLSRTPSSIPPSSSSSSAQNRAHKSRAQHYTRPPRTQQPRGRPTDHSGDFQRSVQHLIYKHNANAKWHTFRKLRECSVARAPCVKGYMAFCDKMGGEFEVLRNNPLYRNLGSRTYCKCPYGGQCI